MAPYARVRMGDDIEACRDELRAELALYIGGMGARDKNFYNDLVRPARNVQNLFLNGKRKEAAAAVPDELIDEMSLIGSTSRIKDRLQAWKGISADGRVGTMVLSGATIEAARVVAEAVL